MHLQERKTPTSLYTSITRKIQRRHTRSQQNNICAHLIICHMNFAQHDGPRSTLAFMNNLQLFLCFTLAGLRLSETYTPELFAHLFLHPAHRQGTDCFIFEERSAGFMATGARRCPRSHCLGIPWLVAEPPPLASCTSA